MTGLKRTNCLLIHPTKYILFSSRDTTSEHGSDLLIDDEKPERVHCTKFLGCSLMNTLYGTIILNTVSIQRSICNQYGKTLAITKTSGNIIL